MDPRVAHNFWNDHVLWKNFNGLLWWLRDWVALFVELFLLGLGLILHGLFSVEQVVSNAGARGENFVDEELVVRVRVVEKQVRVGSIVYVGLIVVSV